MDNQNEKMFETFLRKPANMHITFNDNHWKYRCSYICSCELSFPRPFANFSLDNLSLGCSQLLELLGCQTIPSPLPKPHFSWRLRLCLVNVKHVSKWLSYIVLQPDEPWSLFLLMKWDTSLFSFLLPPAATTACFLSVSISHCPGRAGEDVPPTSNYTFFVTLSVRNLALLVYKPLSLVSGNCPGGYLRGSIF